MKRALWLALTLFFVACGGSPATPTLDVTSRDATSIVWQMATIEAAMPRRRVWRHLRPAPVATQPLPPRHHNRVPRRSLPHPPLSRSRVFLNQNAARVRCTAAPGEPVAIPSRRAEIRSGYQALMLYADTRRITLTYTQQDNISFGYTVYIEDVCVDPNLLVLYRAQNDTDGWRRSSMLSALRNGQVLGRAARSELVVAIWDRASFMDPRAMIGGSAPR